MNGSLSFGLIRKNRTTTRILAALVATIVPVSLIGSGSAGSAAQIDNSAGTSLYFVVLDGAPLSLRPGDWNASGLVSARRNQEPVLAAARELGAGIGFRYSRAVNGFSARMTERAARRLAETPGVAYVEPVPIVRSALSDSVNHIGTKRAWADHRVKGKGVHVAVIDSGVDYTHRAFRGAGTSTAYNQNDPRKIERGSFPTGKVVAGYDFVGDNYDVLDESTTNDTPKPDEDPLDPQGHGTHVAHTCCGKRVPGIGKGVAPKSKIHAYKVWGNGGSSTADVLVAAYERALDPNGDGNLRDRVDVVNFSGGVYYGTPSSTESVAASNLVDAGITFVAAAGNSSGHAYRIGSPATAPGVLSVSATDLNDKIAGFSSPGPARSGFGFKPEITGPGVSILAAQVGTGTGGMFLSGTSMASPHVAGAAALLVDLHPGWSPAEIKAALVNHADPNVTARGSRPGPATLIGAGLVQVDGSADAVSLAIPSTISFGAPHLGLLAELPGAPFRVVNKDRKGHRYVLTSAPGFANVEPGAASVDLSVDGDPFASKISFWLKPKASRLVTPRLSFEPGLISDADELLARFGQLPLIDGAVVIRQRKNGRDRLRVPWMVVPHVASDVSLVSEQVDLTGGIGSLDLDVRTTAGVAAADLYVLGGNDPGGDVSPAEADIVAFGARSFAGFGLGDGPEGLPEELDARSDGDWLSSIGAPGLSEPVEVGVVTSGIHETIETLQVTVLIDAGADGVFSDPVLKADHMVLKPMFGRSACVRAVPDPATTCVDAGVDYDLFDSNLLGLVFDAFDVGLSEGDPVFSYRVQVCSDTFSGDVPAPICDSSPGVGPGGTYPALLDVTEPRPLPESPLCGGFWSNSDCRSGLELSGAPSDPDVLVFFPNNAPSGSHAVARTP